jgi:hypothetical protein
MASDTTLRTRIDRETKAKAASVLEAMGLSVSDAVRLMTREWLWRVRFLLTRSFRMPRRSKQWKRPDTMMS